jgi:hypothetical protein
MAIQLELSCRKQRHYHWRRFKGDFDLQDTTRRGRDVRELEPAQGVVVLGASTTLEYRDEHTQLLVFVEKVSDFFISTESSLDTE